MKWKTNKGQWDDWKNWFAWYPIEIKDDEWIWLQWIQWREYIGSSGGDIYTDNKLK